MMMEANRSQAGMSRLTRRTLLALSPFLLVKASKVAEAATSNWHFFANVNFQGLEGGDVVPGVIGTNYFAPAASDLSYVTARTNGASRLPFRWERMQPIIGGALDPTYMSEIKSVARSAASSGTTIILDCHNYMHRTVDGADRYIDNRDGVLTRAHLADLWQKIAKTFLNTQGISGYDIMNEPQGPFGKDGSSADLAAVMQASVDAISAVDRNKTIFVEGNGWSSAEHWVRNNSSYPLNDRYDRIVYSAHCYADFDASGTHYDYASQISHNIPVTVLADRTTPFAQWLESKKLRGHIGETNVGIDDPLWLDTLNIGLEFWKRHNLPVNIWLYGAYFGANPFNLFPYSGSASPQWGIIKKYVSK